MEIKDMPRSLQVFREHVEGSKPFPSDVYDILYWQSVVYDWVRGLPHPDEHIVLSMNILCHSLIDLFPFQGTIYRGTQMDPLQTMEPKTIASFSSYDEVALFFAGESEIYGTNERPGLTSRTLISTSHPDAFHLSRFLEHIHPLVDLSFKTLIDERNWESEVLAPLTPYMIASATPLEISATSH